MAVTHSTQQFGNAFLRPPQKSATVPLKTPTGAKAPAQHHAERKLTFTKIFRWRLSDGETREPSAVEVAGTFTNWQKKPLIYDRAMRTWHTTLHHIQGNRTHHYMLLVDGKPVEDTHCDGMAIPNGAQELQFAIATARGPRVLMLFSQTK
jgi:hypothetical protein